MKLDSGQQRTLASLVFFAVVLFAGAVVATGYFICDGTTPKGAAAGAACAGSLL